MLQQVPELESNVSPVLQVKHCVGRVPLQILQLESQATGVVWQDFKVVLRVKPNLHVKQLVEVAPSQVRQELSQSPHYELEVS